VARKQPPAQESRTGFLSQFPAATKGIAAALAVLIVAFLLSWKFLPLRSNKQTEETQKQKPQVETINPSSDAPQQKTEAQKQEVHTETTAPPVAGQQKSPSSPETKKKAESHRRNAQPNKSKAPDDSAPSSQAGGNSGSAQQNPAVTQSAQGNNGLSLLFPSIRAKNDAQTNKSTATDASVPSSQAGVDSGSARQMPALTQPETKSNPSPDGDAKIHEVQEAFKEQDWEKTVSLSRELANAGDPRGMYYLGRAYTLGVGGVPKNWEQEKYWYEKSAAAGYCYAMYMLGISYNANGDSEHAMEWFRKGASAQPQECADMCAKRVQRKH
jgi:hypothetical protein